ncbi:hypothetical protein GMNKNHGO_00138 [Enterococcus phage vB_Efa29212_3e]|uniref:HNH nuclease domain-containing protein n=1 Tax=Enterococcus phage vB_Efa29212_3e TaxID=2982224 RepID=A0A978ACB5_9CAUD|nr:hypothetical protein GMNKNHGO_00138 [Enterococcus phage vB_Efa29212_3e]
MEKTIKDFESYTINEDGQVYSKRSNIYLKPDIDKDGYEIFRLSNKGVKKAFKGHRLVALAFIPNPENLPIINHIDGNKRNNTVTNLEWCTNQQNIQHAYNTGLTEAYTRGLEIYDINKKCVVSRFNSYDDLAKVTSLSKLSLIDIVYHDKLLYQGFKIRRANKDFSGDALLNAKFINRTINGRFKPLRWDGLIFDSQASFKKHIGLANIEAKLRSMKHENKDITRISQYEYVTY